MECRPDMDDRHAKVMFGDPLIQLLGSSALQRIEVREQCWTARTCLNYPKKLKIYSNKDLLLHYFIY